MITPPGADSADSSEPLQQKAPSRARRPTDPSLAPPPYGALGVLEALPDGNGVRCHVCGGFFIFLGTHVRRAHGLTAAAYRERFGLNRGTSLAAESFRAVQRRHAQERGAARGLRPPPHDVATDARRLPRRLQGRLASAAATRGRHVTRSPGQPEFVPCSRCGVPLERVQWPMHRTRGVYCSPCARARVRETRRAWYERRTPEQRARRKAQAREWARKRAAARQRE